MSAPETGAAGAPADGPRELVILPSLRARRGPGGGLVLTGKYLDGAAAFARGWPGPAVSLVGLTDRAGGDFDPVEVFGSARGAAVEIRPDDPAALAARLSGAAAVLAFLSPEAWTATAICRRLGVPIVFYCEYSPRTERQIADAELRNPLRRLRRRLWLRGAERKRLALLPLAAGLQCSGTPVFDHYGPRHPNPLLFFDNRTHLSEVIGEADLEAKLSSAGGGRPLRFVYGGRFTAMKGVMDLPEVAAAIARRGVPFSLAIFGDGPLGPALSARIAALGLGDRVALRAPVDFRNGWLPILRNESDLFLCCHPQGDPSSTYPEVMSCGVPIAGYDNEAFLGVVRLSGAGRATPTGRPEALADAAAKLHADRAALAEAARRGRAFAVRHAFEPTFARRTAHLVEASRLPESAKAQALAKLSHPAGPDGG